MAQDATDKTLNEVFKEACGVFLVGIHPEHREDAKRALAGFLSLAQMIGYKSGWADGQAAGPAPKSLSELLAEDEPVLSDQLRRELYDVVAEARRGGGIEGGTDYTVSNLESVVEDAIKEATARAKPKGKGLCACGYLGRVHTSSLCGSGRPAAPVKSCACGSTIPARCAERCEKDDL
jgi:hypothetical protein